VQREKLEMEAYFRPELCRRSRQIVEGAQVGEESMSLRSYGGGDAGRGRREERAHERLHKLSSKKQEYIFELKRLMDKEQTLQELKNCTFRPLLQR
jgi:hypothetical protein